VSGERLWPRDRGRTVTPKLMPWAGPPKLPSAAQPATAHSYRRRQLSARGRRVAQATHQAMKGESYINNLFNLGGPPTLMVMSAEPVASFRPPPTCHLATSAPAVGLRRSVWGMDMRHC
jgi:hypothetical protein